MAKKVPTYSWLARKAMALCRKDRDEYEKMLGGGGTTKMLRGCRVIWSPHNYSTPLFAIFHGEQGPRICAIYPLRRHGKAYSLYTATFSATEYRKSVVEKYMPITLPEGVRARSNQRGSETKCIFHHADGSVAGTGVWHGGRRGKPGYPSQSLILRDEDGQFMPGEDAGNFEECDESLFDLGWFDNASATRKEWLASVDSIPAELIDRGQMLTVAARAWLAASRMCEKNPRMRMALFPAMPFTDELSTVKRLRFANYEPRSVVLSRSDDGMPSLWYMPEVLVYWKERDTEREGYVCLTMTVPPHGSPLMDPTGRSGVLSKTARNPRQARDAWAPVPVPTGFECAYHAMAAWDPKSPPSERGTLAPISRFYKHNAPPVHMEYCEKGVVFWPNNRHLVVATLSTRHLVDSAVEGLPLDFNVPVAMKPEDVLFAFEEKMLMSSLPLC